MALGGGKAATVAVDVEADLDEFKKDIRKAGDIAEKELGGKSGGFSKGAGIAGAAIGAATGVAIIKGIGDAMNAEQVNVNLAASLGLDPDGEEAKELGEISANLYRDAWGDSLEEVALAVADTRAAFDFGEPQEIEAWTAQALALADTFGLSVEEIMGTASTAFYSGLTKDDPNEIFDAIAASAQQVPQALRGEILAAGSEYSQFFNDLGFNSEEAFGILVANSGDGAYGIDKAGDAIKEFTIRATDGSTASVEALEAIGLEAGDTANAFLAGGETAQTAFQDVISGLLAIEDPAERANAAIALFGTPIEDLGVNDIPQFLRGLQDGTSALEDMDGAAQEVADTVGDTAQAKFESFKRNALGSLADFAATTLIPALEQILPVLQGFLELVNALPQPVKTAALGLGLFAGVVVKLGPAFLGAAKGISAAFKLLAANPYILIIAATIALVILIVKNWDTIKEALAAAWNWIKDTAATVWNAISGFFEEWWRVLVVIFTGGLGLIALWIFDNWDAIWSKTMEIWNGIYGFLEGILSGISGFITDYILNPVGSIIDFFARLPETARNAWEAVKGAIVDAKDGILSALGEIGSAADRALGPLDEIAGFVIGGVGGLLGFDDGGVVPGPTGAPRLVLAHGGETFIPTHKRGMEGAAGNGGGIVVNLHDATIRNDDDIVRLARMLDEETRRVRRSQGGK